MEYLSVDPIKFISIIYRKIKPLVIKPNKKKILFSQSGNDWNEQFFIYLINYTKNSYYGINVVAEFPNYIDVTIIPEAKLNEFSDLNNKISIGADFAICGENKDRGMKSTQSVINNIGPEEKRKITIKVIVDKTAVNKEDFSIKFKIASFSKEPKPILSK